MEQFSWFRSNFVLINFSGQFQNGIQLLKCFLTITQRKERKRIWFSLERSSSFTESQIFWTFISNSLEHLWKKFGRYNAIMLFFRFSIFFVTRLEFKHVLRTSYLPSRWSNIDQKSVAAVWSFKNILSMIPFFLNGVNTDFATLPLSFMTQSTFP
jgi:hypothetical protein